jgi:hypothetical protein
LEPKAKVEKYAAQSWHYLINASKFIDANDSEKASEFLWGSLAEALKALALSEGISLQKHGQIWNYVEELTKEKEDKDIYDVFLHANALHKNFYELELDHEKVRRMAEDVKVTVEKLISYIPKENKEND